MSISKGYLYIIAGILVLLYVFGFIQKAFTVALVSAALGLIVYGVFKTGLYELIKNRLAKK